LLQMPLDYEFTQAMSSNIQDRQWPVRLATIYVLSKKQGEKFSKVLDWSAQYDQNQIVRDMSVALGGKQAVDEQPEAAAEQSD